MSIFQYSFVYTLLFSAKKISFNDTLFRFVVVILTYEKEMMNVITRKNFLVWLTQLPVFAALISAEEASSEKPILLDKVYVAGLQYYDADTVADRLRRNDAVILRRQPDNPYDSRAIEVLTNDGTKLGYIPRRANHAPYHLLRQNIKLTAIIDSVSGFELEIAEIKLKIYLGALTDTKRTSLMRDNSDNV